MEYILQTNQVSKTIGGKSLVSNIDLHVKKGEIYGFLGLNGAGKTTSNAWPIRRSASNTDGRAAPPGGAYRLFCSSYGQNWRTCTMSQLLPYETIVKASEGDPEAVAAVLSHYAGYIRTYSKIDGHINVEMQEHIIQKLIESLFKFHFDR